jgi:phosphoribosylformylglycinamidine cyclo-ligase
MVLLGLPSTGLHTNGYSLARKLLFEVKGFSVETPLADLGCTVGEALLAVHRSYLRPVAALLDAGVPLAALSHITGGGLPDNVPRVLPEGVRARVRPGSWVEPALFGYIRREGAVPEEDMRRTFNLGVGMVLALPEGEAARALGLLEGMGERPAVIGELVPGERGVEFV